MPASARRLSMAARLSIALASMSFTAEHSKTRCCRRGIGGHARVDPVFEGSRVGEGEAFVHPEAQQSVIGTHRVAVAVAEVPGPMHEPHFFPCWPRFSSRLNTL